MFVWSPAGTVPGLEEGKSSEARSALQAPVVMLSQPLLVLCVAAGTVPGLEEGNFSEPIMPWSDPHNGRVVLGATVEEACPGPAQLHEALHSFSGAQAGAACAARGGWEGREGGEAGSVGGGGGVCEAVARVAGAPAFSSGERARASRWAAPHPAAFPGHAEQDRGTHAPARRAVLCSSFSCSRANSSCSPPPRPLLPAGRQYALTYRPDTRKCYALLKEGAYLQSVLQAAMDAHCLLWMLDHPQPQHPQQQAATSAGPAKSKQRGGGGGGNSSKYMPHTGHSGSDATDLPPGVVGKLHVAAQQLGSAGPAPERVAVEFVARGELFREFLRQAEQGGWRLPMTSLNPKETRLVLA